MCDAKSLDTGFRMFKQHIWDNSIINEHKYRTEKASPLGPPRTAS